MWLRPDSRNRYSFTTGPNIGTTHYFYDDDEELANVMIEEWATYDGDDFMENVEPSLKKYPMPNERGGRL